VRKDAQRSQRCLDKAKVDDRSQLSHSLIVRQGLQSWKSAYSLNALRKVTGKLSRAEGRSVHTKIPKRPPKISGVAAALVKDDEPKFEGTGLEVEFYCSCKGSPCARGFSNFTHMEQLPCPIVPLRCSTESERPLYLMTGAADLSIDCKNV
jgi:hypothetical protein